MCHGDVTVRLDGNIGNRLTGRDENNNELCYDKSGNLIDNSRNDTYRQNEEGGNANC